MGKNSKKYKKDRERSALLGIALAAKGEPRPPLNPTWAEQQQDIDEEDEYGALIIRIDDDLDVPDYPTSALPLPKGRRTKTSDKDRFYEWFLREELKAPNAKLDRISRDDIRHVRTHAQLSSMVDYFIDLSKSSGDEFIIALDTEGSVPRTQPSIAEKASDEPALLQLAARVGKKQIVAVIQLYSKRDRADIFSEGEPTRLAEIFRIKNAILAGKAIAGDIRKVACASGLSYEELGEIQNHPKHFRGRIVT